MQLEHGFTVPVPVERAWDVLLDLPQVAPCMPGASLTSYEGDDFTGTVKVKLGPINLTYQGQGRISERNVDDRRAVIEASGKERRGGGTAKATVTANLRPDGDGSTRVDVTTDLTITGRPAQFGRGMMVDVGNKLIGQFADCLSGKLTGGEAAESGVAAARGAGGAGEMPGAATPSSPAATAPATGAAPATPVRPTAPGVAPAATPGVDVGPMEHEVEPIDLLEVTGAGELVKRVATYAAAFAAGLLVGWLIFRGGKGG